MERNIGKLLILLLLYVSLLSVYGQNEESFQNYDLVKSIKKSSEDISFSKNLKVISDEDKIFLSEFQDFLPKSIHPILLELLSEVASDKCVQDLKHAMDSISPHTEWALKMFDSFGKPESGFLLGNVKWLGKYDECLKVYAPPKGNVGDFHGKYCTVQIPIKIRNQELPISTAVCLPDSCNPNSTFDGMFKNIPKNFNLTGGNANLESILSNATITCKANSREITTGFIVVLSLLSIIAFLAVIGSSITVLEYTLKAATKSGNTVDKSSINGIVENGSLDDSLLIYRNKEVVLPAWLEKCKPFFNCFCIFTNGEKILDTAGVEGQLPCLHGLRFLSMAWVILCHSYLACGSYINNPLEALDLINRWTFQVVMNGWFSVDSFFVLSAFLVGYVYFTHAPKTDGKIPWLYFYIHRYIRLTPVYMIALGFHATVVPYLGSGPLWPEDNIVKTCEGDWWWHMLYINNFQKLTNQCMGYTWYLANDMQFYVISPLFLITLYKWPKIGYSLLGLFFSITFTANFAITYEYDLVAGIGNIGENDTDLQTYMPKLTDLMIMVYSKPYTRIGPYLVGLLVAYIVYQRKQNNSGKLNKIALGIGWVLGSCITLACQFGLYHYNLSTIEASFYNALSRIGFALGLGWVIFVCVTGQGGVVNSILSWKPLIPLSRLTYCAYLVHPMVQNTYLSSLRALIVFNHINILMFFLGSLFIAYSAALVTSLLFESPVIRLERLLRDKLST